MKRFLLLLALMFAVAHRGFSATAPLQSTPRGVLINATTRNRAPSKINFQLARNGKALAPIVISDKASVQTKLVAEELKKYLDAMSGASFQIQTGDGASGIVLGNQSEFPVPALGKALQIVHGFEGKEAYAIRTREKRVLLLGATDLAASHAAYRFLEELGCRWFFQSDAWQVIPSTPDLKFNLDITDRPEFLARRIWWGWAYFWDKGHPGSTPEHPRDAVSDYEDWARRNAMAASLDANAGHAYEQIVQENKELMDAHPEYRALVDGKRQGNHLELSNPGARKMVVDWAINYFKKHPESQMVSVDPEDGGGFSQSEESRKLGEPSEIAFGMANEVAVALRKAFPGQNKMVGILAYSWHSDPPPFKLEPNVYVQLAGSVSGKLTYEELREAWPKKTGNLGFYQYFAVYDWTGDRWPGGMTGNVNQVREAFANMVKANKASGTIATSISAESSNSWGLHGRGYYLANRLMWNSGLDVNALLDDFYSKAFGAGAGEMKKYFEMQDNPPPLAPGVYGALFRHVDAASRATQNDAAVQRRLDDIKTALRWEYLRYRRDRASDPEEGKKFFTESLRTVYRTRYDYMNHWAAIWQMEAVRSGMDKSIWEDATPMTHEETERNFQEALHYFPVQEVPKQEQFSDDYVLVNMGGKPLDFQSPQYQQNGRTFIFVSKKGEPLRVKITMWGLYGGTKLWYKFRDRAGKILAEDKPIGPTGGYKDSKLLDLKIAVPKAGTYFLEYFDGSGSMFSLEVAREQAFGCVLSPVGMATSLYGSTPRMYFYVPKGVQEIRYYYKRSLWTDAGPHQVIDPDGKVVKEVDVNGDYVFVPVPPGQDGKAWSFGGPRFGLGTLHFFNVPDVLSPSPAQLLVPRELTLKDQLKTIQ